MTRIVLAARTFIAIALAVAMLSRGAGAAPMFPDVPDMWAADAVRTLAAKGLLEGYPDGTFKGDRAATRYEVAMIVARLLAREEQEHALFASKADLDELMRLARQLSEELDALGVRVTNLEGNVATLDKRVTALERVTFYGSMRTIGLSQNFSGAPFVGTTANPGVDYSNGRLLFSGVGATGRMMLGVHAKLNPDMDAGLEVVAYSATGSSAVEQYWGVTPNYQSNPFLAQATFPAANGSTTASGLMQGDSHQPFTKMSLDRFWLQDRTRDYQLVMGSWQSQNVGDQVLLGIRNPNVNAPAILPFWGFQVTPLDRKDKFQYEFGYSQLPTGTLYRGWLGTASSFYDFGRGTIGVSLLKLGQDATTDGQALPGGLTPLPTANGQQLLWRDARTGFLTSVIGPQNQFTWGANLNLDLIPKWLALRANYGGSRYNPDMSSTFLSTIVNGSMYDIGLVGHLGQFRPEVEYLHVDPTYDTAMLPYAVNPGLPVFLPYGNWYSSNYQLHDYLKYPTNREGWRGWLNWENDDSAAFAMVESFTQTKATTFDQITTPGNAEALFPIILTPGDASRGTTLTHGLGFMHQFDNKLRLAGSWYDYALRRGGAAIDNVNFTQNFYRISLSYPIAERLDASLNYAFLDFSGHTGLLTQTFEQSIPGLTISWQMARNTTVNFNARLFNYIDRAVGANNWHGNQVGVDVNLDI
jgi:hypothetical protein